MGFITFCSDCVITWEDVTINPKLTQPNSILRGDGCGKDNVSSWPCTTPQNPSVLGMGAFPPSDIRFRTWWIDFEYWICLGTPIERVVEGAPRFAEATDDGNAASVCKTSGGQPDRLLPRVLARMGWHYQLTDRSGAANRATLAVEF